MYGKTPLLADTKRLIKICSYPSAMTVYQDHMNDAIVYVVEDRQIGELSRFSFNRKDIDTSPGQRLLSVDEQQVLKVSRNVAMARAHGC